MGMSSFWGLGKRKMLEVEQKWLCANGKSAINFHSFLEKKNDAWKSAIRTSDVLSIVLDLATCTCLLDAFVV